MTQLLLNDVCYNRHGGNEQSVEANRHVDKQKQSKLILEALERVGEATCEQIEYAASLSHQSCSARISELKRDGKIVKVGTRKTRSGCSAAVYRSV